MLEELNVSLLDGPEAFEPVGESSEDFASSHLARVSKIPKLTATEERELVKRWFKKRDEKARERLITANLYLVLPIAKKWAYRFFNNDKAVDELIAEGNLALMEAFKHFKPSHGRFQHYARTCIRNAILRQAKALHSVVLRPIYAPSISDIALPEELEL